MKDRNGEVMESIDNLKSDAQSLLTATENVAGKKVIAARNRLAGALDAAKEVYDGFQDRVVSSAKTADKIVRDRPYQAIGVALGIGALTGFLWSRRSRD